MKIGTLLPAPDLLQQVRGVEEGLRKSRRAGWVGWIGLAVSLIELALVAFIGPALEGKRNQLILTGLLFLFVIILTSSLYFLSRARFWKKESHEAFRYTCHVGAFEGVGGTEAALYPQIAGWMAFDLRIRLNERVGRLSFVDKPPDGDGQSDRSHIEVDGQYLIREKGEERIVEVIPRVRVGRADAPQTLAYPVRFSLGAKDEGDPSQELEAGPVRQETDEPGTKRAPIEQPEYEKLLERVYFSLATQIYRQIRSDIETKINLLPTRFLRATAYLYEADDYVRSNTLDAYEEARQLYDEAQQLYDPRLRVLPRPKLRRPYQLFLRAKALCTWPLRRWLANVWARLGTLEVLTARAEIGYANALLHRRILATMSGHRVNPIYGARPALESAVARLERTPLEVPGRQDALFSAHVAFALTWSQLESMSNAQAQLKSARRIRPLLYSEDSRYLYVAGVVERRLRVALPQLRKAIERDPRSEIAQFELAVRSEMDWRERSLLEPTVARLVLDEYEEVLKLDPGNVAAWGHIGYVQWILGDLGKARAAYVRGLEYKQIRRGTDVAALDHGLAQVAAEEGHFDEAYRHHLAAVSTQVTEGVSDNRHTSSQFYRFDYVGWRMVERYRRYHCRVRDHFERAGEPDDKSHDAVMSFAENDVGEALHTYAIRTGSLGIVKEARRHYEEALRQNPALLTAHYNLYSLEVYAAGREATGPAPSSESSGVRIAGHLRTIQELAPTWPDGILARLAATAEQASDQALSGSSMDALAPSLQRIVRFQEVTTDELEVLLPHAWLWNRRRDGEAAFNWSIVRSRARDKGRVWVTELDDLQVRALFAWALVHAEARSDAVRAGTTKDAIALVGLIRSELWPGNFRVLMSWSRLCPERRRHPTVSPDPSRICDTLCGWIESDPTSHWALETMITTIRTHGPDTTGLKNADVLRSLERARLRLQEVAGGEDECVRSRREAWIDEKLAEMESISKADAAV